ncbi:hypothetical protein DAEQUDRAFT_341039 [Daedalea quercina L-15889]|uniref:Mid2 domain-containing protein n=1 Tax=Daedalea quercina L-15889 TaxID=1314783 RepID=A0A165PFA4_9APHY|nr:hypothetical protein DAEQUDRAFT_341039 [Daedalea quercina L-15889]
MIPLQSNPVKSEQQPDTMDKYPGFGLPRSLLPTRPKCPRHFFAYACHIVLSCSGSSLSFSLQACLNCAVRLNPNLTFDGTWHDTTARPGDQISSNLTMSFIGIAAWIYCILYNDPAQMDVTRYTIISFELDGAAAGTYSHVPGQDVEFGVQSDDYLYNVTVFAQTDLSNAEHTLVITAVAGSDPSLLLFDWAMYTFDDDIPLQPKSTTTAHIAVATTSQDSTSTTSSTATTSPASSNPGTSTPTDTSGIAKGAIAGGVIVGVFFIVLCRLVRCYCRRQKMERTRNTMDQRTVRPYYPFPTTEVLDTATALHDRHTCPLLFAPVPSSGTPPSAATAGSSSSIVQANALDAAKRQPARDAESMAIPTTPASSQGQSTMMDSGDTGVREETGFLRAEGTELRVERSDGSDSPPPAYVPA